MSDKRETVPLEDAILMLPDRPNVHTFRGGGFCLVGADWERGKLIAEMERCGVELSGAVALSMNHGLCLHDATGWLFIETRPHN